MKATQIRFPAPNQAEVIEMELKNPGPSEYLTELVYSAISPGTELVTFTGAETTPIKYPKVPGYSGVAKVLEKGSPDLPLEPGTLVAGRFCHRSHALSPAADTYPVPGNADLKAVSAYRLASIALAGVRKARIQIGDSVAVMGLGPIGNFAAQFAFRAGALSITGFELDADRIERAKACGIPARLNSGDGDDNRFDCVIEATGSPQPILDAFRMVKKKGMVVLLGTTRTTVPDFDFTNLLHRKMLRVVGAHETYRAMEGDDYEEYCSHGKDARTVIEFMLSGRLNLSPLIDTVYPYTSALEVYQGLRDRTITAPLPLFSWL